MKTLSLALMIVGAVCIALAFILKQELFAWSGIGITYIGELLPRFTAIRLHIPRVRHRPVATLPVDRAAPTERKSA